MQFTEDFALPCSVDTAWRVLSDPLRMTDCVPGLDKSTVREIGTDEYAGIVKITIARIPAKFAVEARIVEAVPTERLVFRLTGRDRWLGSTLTASSVLEVHEEDARTTRIHHSLDVNVTGKVATFGYPVILAKSKEFSDEFVSALQRQVAEMQG